MPTLVVRARRLRFILMLISVLGLQFVMVGATSDDVDYIGLFHVLFLISQAVLISLLVWRPTLTIDQTGIVQRMLGRMTTTRWCEIETVQQQGRHIMWRLKRPPTGMSGWSRKLTGYDGGVLDGWEMKPDVLFETIRSYHEKALS